MWITPLCPRFAFVKLSVAKASLPHCNCPSDSRVYAAAGGEQTRGEGGGWGVTGEKKRGAGGRWKWAEGCSESQRKNESGNL